MKTFLFRPIALAAVALLRARRRPCRNIESSRRRDKAPLVEGKDQDGKSWKLAERRWKKSCCSIFIQRHTPGCTKEACGLRDRYGRLEEGQTWKSSASALIPPTATRSSSPSTLSIPAAGDTDGKIADTFGVRMQPGKSMARRVSFLIGKTEKSSTSRTIRARRSPDRNAGSDCQAAEELVLKETPRLNREEFRFRRG